MTRQVTDQLYIDLGYLTPEDYYTYQAEAAVTQAASAAMTVTAGVIQQGASAMTVTATQVATISHIEGADLFAFTEAQIAVQIDRIRNNNIEVSSQFSAATDVSRIIHLSSDEFSAATIFVSDNIRVRYYEAASSAAFSLTCDGTLVPGGEVLEAEALLSSEFGIDAKGTRKTNIIDCDVTSAFTQSTSADRIRFATPALEITANQYLDALKIMQLETSASASVSTTAQVNAVFDSSSSVNSLAEFTVIGLRIKDFEINAGSLFTPGISVDAVKNSFAVLDSVASLTISSQVDKTAQVSLALTASAAISATKYFGYFYVTSEEDVGSGSSEYHAYTALVRDALENTYAVGYGNLNSSTGFYSPIIDKFDKYGNLLWSKNLSNSYLSYFSSVAIRGSNIVAAGSINGDIIVAEYNSSGSLVTTYTRSTAYNLTVNSVVVDSNQDIFVGGVHDSPTVRGFVYRATGSTWFRYYTPKISKLYAYGTNLYYTGGSGTTTGSFGKINSSDGISLWSKLISADGTNKQFPLYPGTITVDSSENIIISKLFSPDSSIYYELIIKVNSSGTTLASKVLSNSNINNLSVSSGSIYASTANGIMKLDGSTLEPIWKKTTSFVVPNAITVDTSGIYVVGEKNKGTSPTRFQGILVKTYLDGSGVPESGTYSFASIPSLISWDIGIGNESNTQSSLANSAVTISTTDIDRTSNITTTTYSITAGGYLQTGAAAISSQATVNAIASKLIKLSGALSASATLTAQIDNAIKTTSASLSSQGFVLAAVGRIPSQTADLASNFNLTVLLGKRLSGLANLQTTSSLTAQALDLDLAQINLQAQFSLTGALTPKILGGVANLATISSLSANPNENSNPNGLGPYYRDISINFEFYFTNKDTASPGSGLNLLEVGGIVDSRYLTAVTEPPNPNFYIVLHQEFDGTDYVEIFMTAPTSVADKSGYYKNVYFTNTAISWDSLATNTWHTFNLTINRTAIQTFVTSCSINSTSVAFTPSYNPDSIGFTLGGPAPNYDNLVLPITGLLVDNSTNPGKQIRNVSISSNTDYTFVTTIASADLTVVPSLSAIANRFKLASADLSSQATTNATALRIKKSSVSLSSSFTTVTNARKAVILHSNQTASASLTTIIGKIQQFNANLTSVASIQPNVTKAVTADVTINAVSSVSATPRVLRGLDSAASVLANLSSSPIKTTSSNSNMSAFYAELAAVSKIGQGLIGLDATATMSVTAKVFTDTPVFLINTTNLSIEASNVLFAQADLTAQATQTLLPTYLRRNESFMTASASMSTQGQRIRYGTSNQVSNTNLQVTNGRLRAYQSAPSSLTALTINNQIVRLAQAQINSAFGIVIIAGEVTRFQANLQAFDFVLMAGRIIHIDEYFQIKIPGESRYLIIVPESRLLTVEQETRVNKIIGR
jgi:hypothetical protein